MFVSTLKETIEVRLEVVVVAIGELQGPGDLRFELPDPRREEERSFMGSCGRLASVERREELHDLLHDEHER